MVDFCHRLYTAIAEIKAFRFELATNIPNGKIYT